MCPLHSILHSDVRENLSQYSITQASGIEYESQQDGSIDKELVAMPGNLKSTPGTHTRERDNQLYMQAMTLRYHPQNHKQI